MKKYLFLAFIFISHYSFADSGKNFEFYKSIPKYESITLSGQEVSIVIKSNYSVTMSAFKNHDSYTKSEISGYGVVSWDAESQMIYLQLNGTIKGSYYRTEDIYRTEREYNVGSTTLNVLFGSGTAETYTYKKVYDHTEYYNASGSNNFSVKVPLTITSDGKYSIEDQRFSVTLTGSTTKTVSYSLKGGTNNLNYGSANSSENSVADEFGQWQWTKDKSLIYLNSTNIQSNQLILAKSVDSLNSNSVFRLYFSCGGQKIEGSSYSSTEAGKLIQLNVSFDDGTNVTLPFLEQRDKYTYATYNRFLEEWNVNATGIIDQIKDKQILILSYKVNGADYSSVFELEGLEVILSYLRK